VKFLCVMLHLVPLFLSNYAWPINYHNTQSLVMMIAARWYRGCWFNARVTHVLSLARVVWRSRNRVLRHNACWRQKCQLMLIIDDLHSSRRVPTRNYVDARRDSMILFCTANQQTTRRKEKKINNLPYEKNILLALTDTCLDCIANGYYLNERSIICINLKKKNVILQTDADWVDDSSF